jgi:hypothetical protein
MHGGQVVSGTDARSLECATDLALPGRWGLALVAA